MARGNLQVIDFSSNRRFRVNAGVTRGYAGEPILHWATYSSGAATNFQTLCTGNTVGVAIDATPVIGTDDFVGISAMDMVVNSGGTVQTKNNFLVSVPVPNFTRIRGDAKTAASMDTDAELLAILWDAVLFDLTSSKYTIDQTAAADTSGLIIVDGNPTKSELDVIVDVRAFRADVS